MTVRQIYDGSNGDATKALYAKLEALGPVGVIALNLFRAQKCSARAKAYRRGGWKREAYGRKDWSLGLLDKALREHGEALGIVWGWKLDPKQSFHCWVLYVETPAGQASFHAEARKSDRDYPHDWDGSGASEERIILWASLLMGEISDLPAPVPRLENPGVEWEFESKAEELTLGLDEDFFSKTS